MHKSLRRILGLGLLGFMLATVVPITFASPQRGGKKGGKKAGKKGGKGAPKKGGRGGSK
jgi:hypothetical protein